MATVDGNVQDISVHDKEHSALGPTQEAQDMSTLDRVVVPMPSFTDPADAMTAAGSVNMSLDTHPVVHAEDYGADVLPGQVSVHTVMDTHSIGEEVGSSQAAGDFPEDRADWQKKHWQAKAREYGLATSGNTDAVSGRVEDHEAEVEAAKSMSATDWKDEIAKAETADDLADLRELYDASGADLSTVVTAFDSREAEINSEN